MGSPKSNFGSYVTAGIGAASGLLTNMFNRKSVSQTNAKNEELARLQNQWQIEQWQRENNYNSPSAQRARLEAAGLNPGLMYGSLDNTAGSATMVSGAGSQQAFQASNPLGADALSLAQIGLINAQRRNVEADTEGKHITNQTLGEQLTATLNLTKSQAQEIETVVKNNEQTYNRIAREIEGLDLANAAKKIENEYLDRNWKTTLRKLTADAKLSEQQLDILEQQAPELIASVAVMNEKNRQETRLPKIEADLQDSFGKYLKVIGGSERTAGLLKNIIGLVAKMAK